MRGDSVHCCRALCSYDGDGGGGGGGGGDSTGVSIEDRRFRPNSLGAGIAQWLERRTRD